MKKFPLNFDKSWSLFLDRDGVINHRLPDDYVKNTEEFKFLPHVVDALKIFDQVFGTIVVVTNQQGIGKKAMTENQLEIIHEYLLKQIKENKGRIDKIYYCPDLKNSGSFYRKPNIGMGLKARKEFNNIKFKKSVMVGDSISDMIFGKKLGMRTVFISDNNNSAIKHHELIDFTFASLFDFAKHINN